MSGNRIFAYLLFVLVAVVVAATVIIGAATFLKGRSDSQVNRLPAAQQAAAINGDKVLLKFEPDELAIASGTLKGNVTFTLPEGLRGNLLGSNGKNVFSSCSSTCKLNPGYENETITIQVIASDARGVPDYEVDKAITFRDLSRGQTDSVVFPIAIPATSFPNLYPQDKYTGELFMDWAGLTDLSLKSGSVASEYDFGKGSIATNFNLSIRNSKDCQGCSDRDWIFTVSRSVSTQIYVYIVALVPLILAIIFLHLLFFSSHAHSKAFEEYPEALIVTILAVLPLRIVLVPPELTGLTRVDLILGFGLMAIVAISVVKYATEVLAAARRPPATAHVGAPEPGADDPK